MTAIEKLAQRMYGTGGLGITNFGLTRGSNANTTLEELAAEIDKALTRLQAGDYEVVDTATLDTLLDVPFNRC